MGDRGGFALADVTAPEDNLGLALEDRGDESRPIPRVVLQVGVLDEDEVAAGRTDPGSHRRAFAPVDAVAHHPYRRVLEGSQDLVGPIHRSVVDDDDFPVDRQIDPTHPPDDLPDGVSLVVDGHDHREQPVRARSGWLARIASGMVVGAHRAMFSWSANHVTVRSRPSRRGTWGFQPSNVAARVMSGLRCTGSSSGSGTKASSEDDPVTSRTSSASSSIVNSAGLPMLIGPVWSESSRAMKPCTSSSA